MKPNFRLLLFLMLLCWSPVYPQDYFQTHSLRPDKVQLVILNPTVGNLENFMRLLQFHAFSIPNLELIGVYYPDQNYDFRKSIEFLKNRPDLPIALHQIKGKLHPDSLFTSNRCSREFYQIFKNSRGVLALGGPDIPPTVYHAQTHLTTEIIDPWRHYFECSFLFHLLGGKQNSDFQPFLKENPNYVILGFCLGMQTLNVATGGTLIQDIPSQVYQIFTIDSVFLTYHLLTN